MLKTSACGQHLGEWIKERLVELLEQDQDHERNRKSDGKADNDESSELLRLKDSDIFCTIVKIGYGKGNKNPVSDLTTFYMLDKEDLAVSTGSNGGSCSVGDSQLTSDSLMEVGGSTTVSSCSAGLSVAAEQMKRRKWKVGVVPQGMSECIRY